VTKVSLNPLQIFAFRTVGLQTFSRGTKRGTLVHRLIRYSLSVNIDIQLFLSLLDDVLE